MTTFTTYTTDTDCKSASARLEAENKAYQLLLSLLTEKQQDYLAKFSYFLVTGGTTGNDYLIRRGYSQNILGGKRLPRADDCTCDGCRELRGHNEEKYIYCYHMMINAPVWDHMIAQLLYIKYNEEVFLENACVQ